MTNAADAGQMPGWGFDVSGQSPRSDIDVVVAPIPYWGYDHRADIRAVDSWQLAVTLADAEVFARWVAEVLELPPVSVVAPTLGAGLLQEIRSDPCGIEELLETWDDGAYWQSRGETGPEIHFDSVLVDDGRRIPVGLVVHELAHHAEFHRAGGLQGHKAVFREAQREIFDLAWPNLRFQCRHPEPPLTCVRMEVLRKKWEPYLDGVAPSNVCSATLLLAGPMEEATHELQRSPDRW